MIVKKAFTSPQTYFAFLDDGREVEVKVQDIKVAPKSTFEDDVEVKSEQKKYIVKSDNISDKLEQQIFNHFERDNNIS